MVGLRLLAVVNKKKENAWLRKETKVAITL
jgi:hypothetical protein